MINIIQENKTKTTLLLPHNLIILNCNTLTVQTFSNIFIQIFLLSMYKKINFLFSIIQKVILNYKFQTNLIFIQKKKRKISLIFVVGGRLWKYWVVCFLFLVLLLYSKYGKTCFVLYAFPVTWWWLLCVLQNILIDWCLNHVLKDNIILWFTKFIIINENYAPDNMVITVFL